MTTQTDSITLKGLSSVEQELTTTATKVQINKTSNEHNTNYFNTMQGRNYN